MELVECDQAATARHDVNRELQIVRAIDAVVRDNVRIRKQDDPAFAMRIINQQRAAFISHTDHGSGRKFGSVAGS